MSNLLIIGAGGHGKIVVEAAEAMNKWSKIAFLDDNYISNKTHHGYSIVGTVGACPDFIGEYQDIFIAIGDNHERSKLIEKYSTLGFNMPIIIHPNAVVSSTVQIQEASIILANVVVNASVKIGRGAIINTSSSIDHDCIIGEAVHICPGVNLAGNVNIDALSFMGIGSCVIQGINIGSKVVVGAGSVVTKDLSDNIKVAGNPAKTLS